MMGWKYIAGGVCLVVLAFLLWKEWRRADRSRLAGRMTAVLLAVAALAGLALPLTYHRTVPAVADGEGILLTEGYEPDSVLAFVRAHPAIHDMWGDMPVGGGKAWPVSRLHVFGYGLTGVEWAGLGTTLRSPPVDFHAGPRAAGIVAVDWQRRLSKGDRLRVQGHWQGHPVKLVLSGLGGALDSAGDVAGGGPGGSGDFSLGTVPAQSGRAVYRLMAIAGGDTLEQEDIPVEVQSGRPLKILILAATPDFENTALANWLAGSGQQVASRTLVSRDKFQSSFINMTPRPLDKLTPLLLAGFDIVIADATALPPEGGMELQALRRQVEENGLGLIIKVDSAGPGGIGIGGMGQAQIGRAGDSMQPPYIRERPGMRTLARDSFSRTAVGGEMYGAGKVVFTTLNTTYSRMLAGQRSAYAAYWAGLLGRVAREPEPGERCQLMPALPRAREPATVKVATAAELPQGMVGGEEVTGGAATTALYLAEDADLLFDWRGVYWPERAGWQTLSTLNGDTTNFYVWPREAWVTLYREQRRRETLSYLAERGDDGGGVGGGRGSDGSGVGRVDGHGHSDVAGQQSVPIPKYWFYSIFLISMLFLWVERKIGGMNGEIIQ
jgi:hypothetical protein